MTKNEILKNIKENGGFDNFRNWNHLEKATWIFNNYNCTKYIANQVAYLI